MVPPGPCLSFEGFIDLYGSDRNGIEIHTQPQLLFNISNIANLDFDGLLFGLKWYYHRNRQIDSSVLQGMIRVVW